MLEDMRTELTQLLGLDVPVVAAPMAGVSDARLAVAVSRAGAIGCIGIGSARTPDWVGAQVAQAVDAGVPFGVGFMAWALAVDSTAFDIALEARPALVSISFGEGEPWVTRAREVGAVVAVQAGTVAEAVAAERAGAGLVVARGGEAGGHGRNEVATLPLLQEVLDVVSVPVLAAGGISGPRGLAAVLAAGAAGAWVGTAFAGCTEATSSPAARRVMARAGATGTVYGRVFDIAQRLAWPPEYGGRALVNDFTREWLGRETDLAAAVSVDRAVPAAGGDGAPDAGGKPDVTTAMARARAEGDVSMAPVYCGQGVGRIRVDVPAAEVVAEFARAADLLRASARAVDAVS
jgi:nitronate monooxygenase